jgi:hypothetical protein
MASAIACSDQLLGLTVTQLVLSAYAVQPLLLFRCTEWLGTGQAHSRRKRAHISRDKHHGTQITRSAACGGPRAGW